MHAVDLHEARRQGAVAFATLGLTSVILGGLLAAATASTPSHLASWAVAYLVLVSGVAQAGLGLGQAVLVNQLARLLVAAQLMGWNLGNVAVLVGTALDVTLLVDVGGVLLVATLVAFAPAARPAPAPRAPALRWCRYGYALLVLVLLLSVPIGLVLART